MVPCINELARDTRWFHASVNCMCLSLQNEDAMGFGGSFQNLQKVVDSPILVAAASGKGALEIGNWSDEDFVDLGWCSVHWVSSTALVNTLCTL